MKHVTPFNIFDAPLVGVNLIEASAGTGKTWNICGLYLRLLLERKLDVHHILVVTFTNAATAELRTRIRARLVDALLHLTDHVPKNSDPFIPTLIDTLLARRGNTREELRQRAETALLNFDDAAIFTIHSFCQRALADNAFASGHAFTQELIPDDSDVRMEVVQDFWRNQITSAALSPELASYLIEKNVSPAAFDAQLKRRLAKPLATYQWPTKDMADINGRSLNAAYAKAQTEWKTARTQILELLNQSLGILNNNSYKEKTIQAAAAGYDFLLEANNPLAGHAEKLKLDLLRSSIVTKRTKAKNQPPQHPFFDMAENLVLEREKLEAQLENARLDILRQLLEAAPETIRHRKRERRLLAFDDLLFNFHDAIKGEKYPWLVELLRQRFPAALVDEFQDTDPLQYEIFETLYNGQDNTLYMVGDPKQAIYRFRNADLHSYLRAKQHAKNIFTIGNNQRSSDALIHAVNQLFEANPQAFLLPDMPFAPAGIGEKRPAAFTDRSSSKNLAPLCLWQLPKTEEGHLTRHVAIQRATEATANEIARLLSAARDDAILIDGQALQASQIAVLVRSHRQGSAIKQALATLNVGSVELSPVSVFASPDAEALERILCAIWTPARLPLLRAALSTELIGSDAQTIAALPDDASALMHAVERFADYRTVWLDHGVGAMIRQVIRQECIAARMLARPDGERRMTNLLHLTELLHQASEMHALPDSLLRWLQTRRVEKNNEEAAQLRLESDRNLVQILTVHKSKGLEFPIVFCPFLWDGNRQRASGIEGREYHADDGSTVINFCLESSADHPIDDAIRTESDAEDLRLIYVALTRAIYRSYVVAGCYLSRNTANQSQTSLLNWLAAGRELRHDEWRKGARKKWLATDIEQAWASLANASQGNVALLPLPTDRAAPLPAETVSPESLSCHPTPPRLPYGWRISSFSGLTRGATHENAASDYDAILSDARDAVNETTGASPIETIASVSANDILHFPKGTNAGLCIHKAFELCDFADPGTWQDAIDKAIAAYPQETAQEAAQDANTLAAMLRRMMQDVLHTTLPDGITLKNIASDKRLNELGFYLPASRFSTDSLHTLLKKHGYPVPALPFADMACYLKGFIDLVFEHNGRYYILDWKSNHRGHDVHHYDAANVRDAMQENAYHLQYLLYSVALNRYLAQRIPDYRYDTHFGGVHYLFVRGVRPDWKNPDGSPSGVFFDRPSAETMAALDALFTSSHAKAA